MARKRRQPKAALTPPRIRTLVTPPVTPSSGMTVDQKAAWLDAEHRKLVEQVGGNSRELTVARQSYRRARSKGGVIPVVHPRKHPAKPNIGSTNLRAPRLREMLLKYMCETPEAPLFSPEGKAYTPAERKRIRFEYLLETLYQKALGGDTAMMKLILERIIPLHKTAELSVSVSAGEHLAFLNRMRHGDTVLRFGNEPALSNVLDMEPSQDSPAGNGKVGRWRLPPVVVSEKIEGEEEEEEDSDAEA